MSSKPMRSSWFSRSKEKWAKITLRGRLALILAPLLIIGGGVAYYSLAYVPSQKTEEPALQTAVVTRGDIVLYATGTGVLIPAAEASVGFSSSGKVKAIHVQAGDEVAAGQLLAELDDATAQIQLAQATRSLKDLTSQSAILTAQKDLAVALQTQTSSRRALAYLISPDALHWEEKLAAAEQALETAQSDSTAATSTETATTISNLQKEVDRAKWSLKYVQSVYQEDYIPDNFTYTEMDSTTHTRVTFISAPTVADIAEARATYAQAQLAVQEYQYLVDVLQGREIPADATGSSLTMLEEARLNLESAQLNLDATRIYAPISGTVISLDAVVGETVGSSSIITIQDLRQPYRLQIYLDESDWTQIKVGYPVEVTFDILSDKVFNGKVTSVNLALTQSGGASVVQAEVQLDEETGIALPSGTGASVDVIGGSAKNAVMVTIDALHEVSEGQYTVFVVENGKPTLRMVEIGLTDTVNAEVKSGLEEGDVVTTGILVTK